MIRPSVFAWAVLAGAVGVGLFQLKQAVQSMDEELLRLNRQIAAEHHTIHLMRAEWSRSNQPQHLESLARVALDIEPMSPAQMSRLGDIPFRAGVAAKPTAQDQKPAPRGVPAAQAPVAPPPAPPAPPARVRAPAPAPAPTPPGASGAGGGAGQ
ncbi:MAG: hypothetical protein ACKOGH_21060, partial [Alphaproteobacteria bacterium]